MNAYETKQKARRARLERAAKRAQSTADAGYAKARAVMDAIPFGQPILVGHHSEGRHRAALKRMDTGMRTFVEESKHAGELASRAAAVGSAGISSDDPDAIEKLREELTKRETTQAQMVERNKRARAAGEEQPFASYQLSNNSANVRRIRERIAQLEKNAQRQNAESIRHGVRVVENADENRLQLIFPGKPSDTVRAALKAHGFRWSPTAEAWQRQLSNGARYAADCVLAKLA